MGKLEKLIKFQNPNYLSVMMLNLPSCGLNITSHEITFSISYAKNSEIF